MSKCIWKFEFEPADVIKLAMPEGAKVVAVGTQQAGRICLWAVVDPHALQEWRHFRVYGTGHEMERDDGEYRSGRVANYIGTVQDGGFVWHVFGAN